MIYLYLLFIGRKLARVRNNFLSGAELETQRPLTAATGTEADVAVQRSDHSP